MPIVKILKQTRFKEKPLLPGMKIEVDQKTADRWVAKKIALIETATQTKTINVPKDVKKPKDLANDNIANRS